jgi:hypothetical protein
MPSCILLGFHKDGARSVKSSESRGSEQAAELPTMAELFDELDRIFRPQLLKQLRRESSPTGPDEGPCQARESEPPVTSSATA